MVHRVRNGEDYLQYLEYVRLNVYKHQLLDDEKGVMAMVVRI